LAETPAPFFLSLALGNLWPALARAYRPFDSTLRHAAQAPRGSSSPFCAEIIPGDKPVAPEPCARASSS